MTIHKICILCYKLGHKQDMVMDLYKGLECWWHKECYLKHKNKTKKEKDAKPK